MRILVTGSRHWTDYRCIEQALARYKGQPVTVIHGAAEGADSLAGIAAVKLGYNVRAFRADWQTYGKAAGPKRNAAMLIQGQPDIVLAFHDALESSKGTRDMVLQALRAGVPVRVFTGEREHVALLAQQDNEEEDPDQATCPGDTT